ncbi:MAG: two-component system response regulator NarL [Halioglobus sp.]|nr:two-component system response regulator NarL [Halioglobus sp.]
MTRILLVDDHPMMRRGMRQLIEMQEGLQVVAEAGSGEEALALVPVHNPDMILMDLNMKGMDGIQTTAALRESGETACILIVTVSDNDSDVIAALRAGADGYLLKDLEPEELVSALLQAERGQLVLSPELTRILASTLRDEKADRTDHAAKLTDRERQILGMIAVGNSNKLIGAALGITEATVKVHVKNLLKKLNLRSRVEAAVWAVSNNLN